MSKWTKCAAILTDRGMVYGINAWTDVKGFNRPQDCRIAEVFSIEANANLVSAAPDLLAALKAIVALDDGDSPDLWHFEAEFDAARAAIAKAESCAS